MTFSSCAGGTRRRSKRKQAAEGASPVGARRGGEAEDRTEANHVGDKIVVQQSDWNCMLGAWINHPMKPFDDVRVRRALACA